MDYIITTEQLTKKYKNFISVNHVSLHIRKGSIFGLPKADVEDALELVGLAEFGDRLAKKYSLGMKQRLGLAGALLGVRRF